MDTRLTPEGRSAVKIVAKGMGYAAAVTVGMHIILAAGRSSAAWWNSSSAAAPGRMTTASPVYYYPPLPYRAPLPVQPAPEAVLPAAPIAMHPFAPTYTVEPFHHFSSQQNRITLYVYGTPPVRSSSGYPCYPMFRYPPYAGYQQRYFTSMYPAGHQFSSRHR